MPGSYNSLEGLEKILMVKLFRPDKLIVATRTYIEKNLGMFDRSCSYIYVTLYQVIDKHHGTYNWPL